MDDLPIKVFLNDFSRKLRTFNFAFTCVDERMKKVIVINLVRTWSGISLIMPVKLPHKSDERRFNTLEAANIQLTYVFPFSHDDQTYQRSV